RFGNTLNVIGISVIYIGHLLILHRTIPELYETLPGLSRRTAVRGASGTKCPQELLKMTIRLRRGSPTNFLRRSGTKNQYQSWISWPLVPWFFVLSNGTIVLITGDNTKR